ncbi:LuxR C-terminal-related transcriptional regulator [Cellulomonas fimi]|uniref:Response regulator transcription factor n=1 Tax=Cellulomonas fimi TaxID=1708 RepID=A0A7Y0M1C1_CELFI|nr:LuxR C-terminal-related transcriptional regulator [Cellulomonas fimi]NMR21253.1 response regulator transcription factor [Cellulomonas fimi]
MSILELDRRTEATTLAEPLTRREIVVLQELSEDVTLEEIATKLFVTRNTVKSQVRSLYRKLGVSTRADAVAWAEAAGLR